MQCIFFYRSVLLLHLNLVVTFYIVVSTMLFVMYIYVALLYYINVLVFKSVHMGIGLSIAHAEEGDQVVVGWS